MITYVTAYAAAFVAFVAADMVWLGLMVNRVYRPALGDILIPGVNLPPAIIFYLLFPVGLLIFAVLPALKSESTAMAVGYGALFGFFTYATYDLSNYATLRNWTVQVTAIDMAWGTVLGAIAALVAYLVTAKVTGTG
jgi:uncharacterized membrane protein